MTRTNKIITIISIVAVLLLGVGYAAIQNITLNIAGKATADANQANFGVKFTGTPTVSDKEKVTAAITDDLNATINVQGISAKGDTVTATYTVQNTSADLSADLAVQTTNSNEEYFTIEAKLAKESIIAGEATTLTVTVELIKTPITAEESSTIGVQITAIPVQPGEEGTSGGIAGGGTTSTVTSKGTYLPTGFRELPGTSLVNGLTIEDESGNQYVWVEVPQDETVYRAETLALDLDTLEGENLTNAYTAIETDLHTYTAYYRNGTQYTDTYSTQEATGLTEEYYYELKNKMLKSVFENGGFYVGKYEVGIDIETETPLVRANEIPFVGVTCSEAQELASGMSSGNYTSSLMFGVQWNLMLKHIEIQAVKNGIAVETIQAALNTDSKDYGNCADSEFTITNTNAKYAEIVEDIDGPAPGDITEIETSYSKEANQMVLLTTGASEAFSMFGIYDIAGNLAELTLECSDDALNPIVFRASCALLDGGAYPINTRGKASGGSSFFTRIQGSALLSKNTKEVTIEIK